MRHRRAAAGLTQRQLAEISGVKQPLIAAIERGTRAPSATTQGALDAALRVRPSALLRVLRPEVMALIERTGATDARVFGSVARGEDDVDSDLDLLVTFPPQADIVTLLVLEDELSALLSVPVDVVSAGSSGQLIQRAQLESVPL